MSTKAFLQTQGDELLSKIKPEKVGHAVDLLVKQFPQCTIAAVPVSYCGYPQGFRFRVSFNDHCEAFSFTLPAKRGNVYAISVNQY